MVLKTKNNWLARLYVFNERYLTPRFLPLNTNLCHFCRVVFFWVPLKVVSAFIVGLAVIIATLWLFFIIIPDFAWWLHWTVWGIITWGFFVWYLADNYKTPADMVEIVGGWIDKIPGPPKCITEPIASFTEVVWEWIKAKKRKICPFIDIETEDDDK